jgi:hypothetical protein
MDKAWFDSLPDLCRNRKFAFEELHALDYPSPRPIVVKVGRGHKKVPVDLWPAAEFLAAALQGEEVFESEVCTIEAFLLQLLCKAVVAASVLGSSACLGHNGLLSLFTARAKLSATTPRYYKEGPTSPKTLNSAAPNIESEPATLCMILEGPAKVESDACAKEGVLQEAQEGWETLSGGQASVNLFEKQNDVAECQDESPKRQKQKYDTAEMATDKEPNEEATIIQSSEPSQKETAKQRRRKKRRERLRQKALGEI